MQLKQRLNVIFNSDSYFIRQVFQPVKFDVPVCNPYACFAFPGQVHLGFPHLYEMP